jgi:hypothetical protein
MQTNRLLLVLAAAMIGAIINANAAQYITNTLSVSVTMAFQQDAIINGNLSTTPKPSIKAFSTKDLIAQMSKTYPAIVANGAVLQALSSIDTDDDVLFQVKNTNGTIVNVSALFTLTPGTEDTWSGTYNGSTKVMKGSNISLLTVTYDDTAMNSKNGIRFGFYGISTTRNGFSPTSTPNTYTFQQTFVQTGSMGEGHTVDGESTNGFIIPRASFSGNGSGTFTASQDQLP